MIIKGSATRTRTDFLINKYTELLNSGIEAETILVLLQNSYKKDFFLTEIKNRLKTNHFENPQIYTFNGLCYNSIRDNWATIETTINIGKPIIQPHLTGLELSHFFFKRAIKETGFDDYNSKINLVHQLFRRNSLIVNNLLPNKEVKKRSQAINETFADDAQKAIDLFKKQTLEFRAFDYIRQASIFSYLYQNTDIFKNIKYLIVDDADEITTLELDFIKKLKPQLKDYCIAYDQFGSSRLGFLNTDTKLINWLEEIFDTEDIIELENPEELFVKIEKKAYTRHLEMLKKAFEIVATLVEEGVSPSEINIITPTTNKALQFTLDEVLSPKHIEYQFLSGSEKLCDNLTVKNVLTLLKLSIGEEIDIFEIRSIISNTLSIPLKNCLCLIENYKKTYTLQHCNLNNDEYNSRLHILISTIDEIKQPEKTLSEKIYIIYKNLVEKLSNDETAISKIVFLTKQITDFEKTFQKYKTNQKLQKSILAQLSNSIISENPATAPNINKNAVLIASAQKIIDYSIRSKYQIWLDTTSSQWLKDDFGTLYNAWVFQQSWDKPEFTYQDNIELSHLKNKKMVRKLALLTDEITAFSSLYDAEGQENEIGIEDYLKVKGNTESKDSNEIDFNFTPREDQKPVLDYKAGKMAINAVPGAGKTTILLALIIKLINNGIKSENIFVLTYMDSAARNFKERIKKACPNLEKLPNISTIHGLALRILKENSNFVKVGLDENFEICDDSQKQRILRELINHYQFNQDDYDKYEKAISTLKLTNLKKRPYTKDLELKRFLNFYNDYNKILKNRNLIDYDDMLSYCVSILENNADIKEYYSNICEILIEDEAQDSSEIQQKLLAILSSKHNNLIRCGDINQAITTTFTNTDLEGFREFTNNATNITMNHSQRCAKDIYKLANKLVEYSFTKNEYENAFFNIKMQEVKNQNPQSSNAIEAKIFEDYNQERSFILEKIRKIFQTEKNATIAILVRNNFNIDEYSKYFSDFGYNVITRSDTLNKQPVFSLVFALLKFCANPWQNEKVLEVARILEEQKLLKISPQEINQINDLKTPFIITTPDEHNSDSLAKLHWDLNYWLENSSLPIAEFTIKAGTHYYNSEIEKSNVHITALMLKSFANQYPILEHLLEKLAEFSQRPISSKFKFFNDEDNKRQINTTENDTSIQIMTYHKSKGDEFDYVFIPELCEDMFSLPLKKENIKIKSKERFIEAVKNLNPNYSKKDETQLQLFQIEENLRLLYVAITRAKRKLYLTSAKKYKKFSKVKEIEPSLLFTELFNFQGE